VLRAEHSESSSRLRRLFDSGHRLDTAGVWLVFFFNLFAAFTFLSWAPTILTSMGFSFAVAMHGVLLFNLTGIAGAIVATWTTNYLGSRCALIVYSAVAAAALLFISRVVAGDIPVTGSAQVPLLLTGFAAAGFSLIGIQVVAYGLSAHVYLTEIRSSGVGWAAGVDDWEVSLVPL